MLGRQAFEDQQLRQKPDELERLGFRSRAICPDREFKGVRSHRESRTVEVDEEGLYDILCTVVDNGSEAKSAMSRRVCSTLEVVQ